MSSPRLLLLTPPMTQLNTPYPATAYLMGTLRRHAPEIAVAQVDGSIELFLRLFCREGIARVVDALPAAHASASVAFVRAHGARFRDSVDAVVRFLQGRDPTLALRIVGREWLPEGPRFAALAADDDDDDPMAWAFGNLGLADRAKHLASLFIDDLADAIREGIDPRFELSRYGETLASSASSFEPMLAALQGPPTLVDDLLDALCGELCPGAAPDLVGLSVPFPGNLYGALRMARVFRARWPGVRIAMGGGYVNTELRELDDPRLFDWIDDLTFDDGERPLLALLGRLSQPDAPLLRTMQRRGGRVVMQSDPALHDIPLRDAGTPDYEGLPLDRYVSLFEMLNPMHRLWSDGRWNKLTIAHGCYWRRCSFCDVTLDYIQRYEPAAADVLVDRIEQIVAQTGQTGFHFVDEAAPPAGLRALAERLRARRVDITWWGNIRFEKAFTPELARALAAAGCVAVSGGLEVASDHLLERMNKGVSVAQVARVTDAFTRAGVMVHAYLMYGFPGETAQDTIDALERVRQLFAAGCLQSAFWHRFAATAHSPIGRDPQTFGIRLRAAAPSGAPRFARNELPFSDPTGVDHDAFAAGLRAAVYNYMHGLGLERDVRTWFTAPAQAAGRDRAHGGRGSRARRREGPSLPAPTVAPDVIARALAQG
ncbi:MAG: radical SAM protein [Deltaproteobacteria bacterium]|nr:radical SAM protein [Deltaproteobacteria bacterium]MBK8715702.1 radical SAM protein [Deltaproteobacteria bacterium]